ncbi:hypothetical protein [Pseudomonas oryzihabitans]|uniref:hypothetical protein n=1 Tax=Pseudomonas oryzihabitans TaxID=47885 RepID=UPI003EBAD130
MDHLRKGALIVGAASGLSIDDIKLSSRKIYALNSAYFFLEENNIDVEALITGDGRFLAKQSKGRLSKLNNLVTFNYDSKQPGYQVLGGKAFFFNCLGRDGFSNDGEKGFYHGCSSFFLAVQYLTFLGYKSIQTLGVKFPPPEMYRRIDDSATQPEFVYHIQLRNIIAMRQFLSKNLVVLESLDTDSNLSILV